MTALYQDILRRTPAAGDPGVAYWIGQLNAGASRGLVGAAFANSHEYHMDLVAGWYGKYLFRTPDPQGQVFWADDLDAGNSDDVGIVQLVSSDEYFGHSLPSGW